MHEGIMLIMRNHNCWDDREIKLSNVLGSTGHLCANCPKDEVKGLEGPPARNRGPRGPIDFDPC